MAAIASADFMGRISPCAGAPRSRVQALGRALETWSTRELRRGLLRAVDNFALLDLVMGWDCQPLSGPALPLDVSFTVSGDQPGARCRVVGSLRPILRAFADILDEVRVEGVAGNLV